MEISEETGGDREEGGGGGGGSTLCVPLMKSLPHLLLTMP